MADQEEITTVVNPLLPECANGYVSLEDMDYESAAGFRPDSVSYYQGVLTSTIPGLVLGACSLIAMIALSIWVILSFCRCFRTSKRIRKDDERDREVEQFITPQDGYSSGRMDPPGVVQQPMSSYHYSTNPNLMSEFDYMKSYPEKPSKTLSNTAVDARFGLPRDLTCTERFHVKGILKISIIIMMLATTGVASWGIAESVNNTDSLVSSFWDVYGDVEDVAKQVNVVLRRLTGLIGESESVLETIMRYDTQVLSVANVPQFQDIQSVLKTGLNFVGEAKGILSEVKGPIETAAETSNKTFVEGLAGFRESLQPPTLAFQEYGRFIAIAVLFGLIILSAIVGGLLAVWARYPRWASSAIILLWFFVTLLMLLGVGLLSGVNYVTKEGCLYAETFVVNYADDFIAPELKSYAMRAIEYYVNPDPPEEYVPGEALSKIVDPQAAALLNLYQNVQGDIDQFLNLIPVVSDISFLDGDLQQALKSVEPTITELNSILSEVDRLASRNNVYKLYFSTKEYICCTLSYDLSSLFDAWVATGCMSLVLAILCTWRIIWFVREKYPYSDPS